MSAIDEVISAFRAAGQTVTSERVGSGPNPTRLNLSRGQRQGLALLAYAWKISPEGDGRERKGLPAPNFRIQATRSHLGPLITEKKRLTIGFGIDSGREIIVAFDG